MTLREKHSEILNHVTAGLHHGMTAWDWDRRNRWKKFLKDLESIDSDSFRTEGEK